LPSSAKRNERLGLVALLWFALNDVAAAAAAGGSVAKTVSSEFADGFTLTELLALAVDRGENANERPMTVRPAINRAARTGAACQRDVA